MLRQKLLLAVAIVLMLFITAIEIQARGPGGGFRGGPRPSFSRGGGPGMGSIGRGRVSRPGGAERVPEARVENRRSDRRDRDQIDRRERRDHAPTREDRERLKDRREEIREDRKDRWDDVDEYRHYWRHGPIYVGMVVTAADFDSYTCTRTTVISSGVTYIECHDHWYQRRYARGSVTYVVVEAPPGR